MMGRNVRGYWLRQDDWFFGWDQDSDATQLFPVVNDPTSDHDLSTQGDLVAGFKEEIQDWRIQMEN